MSSFPSTSAQSSAAGPAGRTASSVLDLIGRTPLIRLRRFERETPGVELYAKAEWQNPGGSVKDRAASRMIADGEASGRLRPGQTIIDATSGNTGIAYAMIGAARDYKVKLCLPENASPERKLILRAFGAELVLTNPLEGTDGAIREVRRMVAAEPGRYFYPDQYSNESNWRAHFDSTAPEIIEQTGGRITHFVAGLGTSGTFMGTGRGLRRFNPAIKLFSFQPDSPFHGLKGLKHMASAMVPPIYDPTLADEDLAGQHRGGLCDGPAARARGRTDGRCLVGRGACGDARRGAPYPRRRAGHGLSGRGRKVFVREVLDRR